MLRQYHAGRFQGGDNPLRVGTIAAGSLYHLPSGRITCDRRAPPTRPWIVEGFLNGLYHAAGRDPRTGHWYDRVISGRSDRAVLRCLANNRRQIVLVRVLQHMEDTGEGADLANAYPALPDVPRFYRRSHARQRLAA